MALINLTSDHVSSPEALQKWLSNIGIRTMVQTINGIGGRLEQIEKSLRQATEASANPDDKMKEIELAMWRKFNNFFNEMKDNEKRHAEECEYECKKRDQEFAKGEKMRNTALEVASSNSSAVMKMALKIQNLESRIAQLEQRQLQ